MIDTQAPHIKQKKTLSPIWILPILASVLAVWLLVGYLQERGSVITLTFPYAKGIEANKTVIRFQGLVVGQVSAVTLDDDKESIVVTAKMNATVDDLLRDGTYFWLVTPKASLTGIEGLDALVGGNYITMRPGGGDRRLKFKGHFDAPLYSTGDDGLMIKLEAKGRGSLDVGTGVYFQQIQIGQILQYDLVPDHNHVRFTAVIEPEYRSLVRKDSRFWNTSGVKVKAGLDGVDVQLDSLATLVSGGISLSSPTDAEPASPGQSYVLHDSADSAAPGFTVSFNAERADGLRVGSPIRHRGLELGSLVDIQLTDQGVTLKALVDNRYQHLFRQGSQFWRVSSRIGLDGVEHLDRLVLGDFIALSPGDGEPRTHFRLDDKPQIARGSGRTVLLEQDTAEGLTLGAPVLYRGLPVGEITHIGLGDSNVQVEAWLPQPYDTLVKQGSHFWRQGGVEVEASLDGIALSTSPLLNLVKGGIAFDSDQGPMANPEHRFQIHPDLQTALQPASRKLVLSTDELRGLTPGAPVYFRELEVGKVEAINLVEDGFEVSLAILGEYHNRLSAQSRFWHRSQITVEGSLSGIKLQAGPIKQLLQGGLAFDNLASATQSDRQIHPDRDSALDRYRNLTLYAPANTKVSVGAPVRFQGQDIGKIKAIELTNDLQHLEMTLALQSRWHAAFAAADSQFHLVEALVNFAGVKHLDTLVTGNFISAQPGTSSQQQDAFRLATDVPLDLPYGEGLRLVLNQPRLGSLQVGSPVLYRQIKVGEVIHTRLADDAASVDIEIQLMPRHQHLVNDTTRFWNASGIYVDFSFFSGAQIDTESLESIMAGGIAFATREPSGSNNQLKARRFTLHNKADSAWMAWDPKF